MLLRSPTCSFLPQNKGWNWDLLSLELNFHWFHSHSIFPQKTLESQLLCFPSDVVFSFLKGRHIVLWFPSYNSDIAYLSEWLIETLLSYGSLQGGFSTVCYWGWAHSSAFFSGILILFSITFLSHFPFLKRKPVTNWCLWGLYFVQFCWNWLAFKLYWNWQLM